MRGRFKPGEQKNINWFTNHKKLLLNNLMIILQLYLRLNTKQNMKYDSKD